ncbi:MAG: hypothetical protein M3541_08820 [Acidobacteriota bacterium]|nr:hypothetical protein [Acidobacteriota bacterium]
MRATGRHALLDMPVCRCHERLRDYPARDASLIGDHDHAEAAQVQLPDSVHSERIEDQARQLVQITGLLDQRSVTIHKYSGSAHVASLRRVDAQTSDADRAVTQREG